MKFHITITEEGVKRFPQHTHDYYEIMHYIEGTGYLAVGEEKYPYSPGSIIIVPPGIVHGSVSETGFVNISIGGSMDHLLYLTEVHTMMDSDMKEGTFLAELIYRNRYSAPEYLNSLCLAYVHFLLKNIQLETDIARAVNFIVEEISNNCTKAEFSVTELLQQSGYSEDYIRAQFHSQIKMTPLQFLHQARIDQAVILMDVYGKSISIAQLAEKCGFMDPIYFSRCFKKATGLSPKAYQAQAHKVRI